MPHAIKFHKTGGPEVLQWEEVTVAQPGPGVVSGPAVPGRAVAEYVIRCPGHSRQRSLHPSSRQWPLRSVAGCSPYQLWPAVHRAISPAFVGVNPQLPT